jgi:ABC-type polysaccharide/polyol phosphate export permease
MSTSSTLGAWEHVHELWQYRDLIRNLVVRDLKVRYKNSILGIAWSWLNPLLMMVVYSLVFTVFFQRKDIAFYPYFLMCGLLPWNFFTDAVLQATGSIVGNAHLVKKVYFPREALPISIVLANLIHFLIALPLLFGLALVSGAPLNWTVLLMPITILVQVIFTAGMALFLATLNVFYRDIQHILGVVTLGWFFLTPVFYPIQTVPEQATILGISFNAQLWLRRLNPMASIVASYRDLLYRGVPTGLDFLLRTAVTAVVVFIIGYAFFQRHSHRFGEET